MCLQETFQKPEKFTLTRYSVVRKDKIDKRKGGLITIIKDSLNYTEIASSNNTECITVNLEPTIAILLSVIYIFVV